ncbi:Glycosyl hydrolases family 16 [Anaerobranca californiensis DSM 14826]|uniref:licheninase n=1 Tax=Anaerobranca californiensis DSM 14826 TaxID=1120989 RepID=A0A1M6RD49_9FIRM|nr:glycoside hydrolase family 16 protein [Anaerobranca californiensis]SHK30356.1 Glycosyl hydrolases family 16 [Anaerobranca californiensis DSM 14826]
MFDDSFWLKRDFFLGRTNLQKENVFIEDDQLHIKIPKLTLNGGEIQSKEELSFGSYEIKMKLPNAPSSITGFFLYKEPDFYHEIDIEIYNEKNTTALFTTYSDGDMQNHHSEEMSFDPTEDFNIYRIDYYPHKVSFYINGDLKVSWTEGFSLEPMRLIVNLWFPKWLEGKVPVEDKFLIIDWIRY